MNNPLALLWTPPGAKIAALQSPFAVFKPHLSIGFGIEGSGSTMFTRECEVGLTPRPHVITITTSQNAHELGISCPQRNGDTAYFNDHFVVRAAAGRFHP